MSVWWAFGQIRTYLTPSTPVQKKTNPGAVASAIAWPLMANYACSGPDGCTRANNMGWRYFVFT